METNERTSEEIRAEATEAAVEVTRLEREHQEVTARLADPQTIFDAQLAIELRQRLDELPLFINASRLRHAMLRVAMFDAEAQEHKARMPELHAAMMEEKPRLDAAQAAYNAKVNAWQGARADADVSRMDANETRGIVRQLESEAHAMGGVVVRRRPQAA
jgi:chromosome condensin MukBEF ATPase and DNA-binding subunit MukB